MLVATREPHDVQVLEAIRELGLELQVIYNKGAVMVLPPGVNKASGLCAALDRLGLSRHSVVAVGDGENDHAFLRAAECGAAVADALPALRDACDLPLDGPAGRGVAELAEKLMAGELDELELARHHVLLGHDEGDEVRLPTYGLGLLVAGPSGSGKSTVTTALLERLVGDGYQCVIVDPEGDYAEYPGVTVLGDPDRVPSVDEVAHVLEHPGHSVVINLIGLQLRDRPAYFAELLPRLTGLRAKLGHPHWLVLDEAHHLMPAEVRHVPLQHPGDLGSVLMITVHPDALSPAALGLVNGTIAVGKEPESTLAAFATARGLDAPALPDGPGDIALWLDGTESGRRLTLAPRPAGAHPAPAQVRGRDHVEGQEFLLHRARAADAAAGQEPAHVRGAGRGPGPRHVAAPPAAGRLLDVDPRLPRRRRAGRRGGGAGTRRGGRRGLDAAARGRPHRRPLHAPRRTHRLRPGPRRPLTTP
ncbi:HAD-IIB family hydrolase [Nonomuraea salmonea]|uniref:HAD-IIB family hydrolase n=1 Tax=Nonomuraea salmonea TaxID=46181 RepID=UPI002FEA465F